MSKKFSTILIAAALILVAALLLMPGSATASQLLGITITPTFTPETPIPTTPETEEPATDTPTPTATEVPTDTPTPTTEVKPPTKTAKPKATELVLLPETGEYPIDPQQGLQWIFAIALLLLIGGIFLRAVEGSQKQE
jgi:outer membrane biosynthesis protein TonB